MALTDGESGGGGIPATMLVGPTNMGYAGGNGGNNGNGYGNGFLGGQDGLWFILLIILLAMGGNGFGNNGNNNYPPYPPYWMMGGFGGAGGNGGGLGTPVIIDNRDDNKSNSDNRTWGFEMADRADRSVQRNFDHSAVMGAVNQVGGEVQDVSMQVCNSASALQNSLCNGFAGVNSNLAGGFADTAAAVSNGFAGANLNLANTAAAHNMALANGFATTAAAMNAGFNNAETAATARQMANMQQGFGLQQSIAQGVNGISAQIADSCGENRLGIADLKYTIATENCADRSAAAENTRDIIDSQNRGTQAILDKLCALELDSVKGQLAQAQRENVGLQNQLNMAAMQASQAAQTAAFQQGLNNEVDALYNRLNNCPVPSTPVYGKTPIFTCNNNGGCGCGCGM